MKTEVIDIFTDGATVGKNGKLGTVKEVAIGVWIPLLKKGYGKRLPGMSNNEAEFQALINGMKLAIMLGFKFVSFYMDSKIICNRANGMIPKKAKFKNERMDYFQKKVLNFSKAFDFVEFNWIPREKNAKADEISKYYCK